MTPRRILAVIAVLCTVGSFAGVSALPLLAVAVLLVAVAECL